MTISDNFKKDWRAVIRAWQEESLRAIAMTSSTWPWMGQLDFDFMDDDDDDNNPEELPPPPKDVCKYHKRIEMPEYSERIYDWPELQDAEARIKKRIVGTIREWPLCNYENAPVGLYYKTERDTSGPITVTPYWQCLSCAVRGGK